MAGFDARVGAFDGTFDGLFVAAGLLRAFAAAEIGWLPDVVGREALAALAFAAFGFAAFAFDVFETFVFAIGP